MEYLNRQETLAGEASAPSGRAALNRLGDCERRERGSRSEEEEVGSVSGGRAPPPPYVPLGLTSRGAAVGVHEGVGHPLVLLQRALLRHAAVDGAQLATLLLPVGHGRLVYCHFFPTVGMQPECGERERTGREQEEGSKKRQERTAEGKKRERKNERKAGKEIRREIGPRWGNIKGYKIETGQRAGRRGIGGVGGLEGGGRGVAIR